MKKKIIILLILYLPILFNYIILFLFYFACMNTSSDVQVKYNFLYYDHIISLIILFTILIHLPFIVTGLILSLISKKYRNMIIYLIISLFLWLVFFCNPILYWFVD